MQGLHKKQTNTKTREGRKHEKYHPSNRAILKNIAKIQIDDWPQMKIMRFRCATDIVIE